MWIFHIAEEENITAIDVLNTAQSQLERDAEGIERGLSIRRSVLARFSRLFVGLPIEDEGL